MKTIVHKAESRGHANYGWLDTHYTFSFANYYNPERMHFGKLRVLNDDHIAPGMGFGTHPHDNMEIITIPLEGELEHKDSMGNTGIIRTDEIQVMSAGTGITHSEYNPNKDKSLKLLQIWVYPNQRNVEPRYDQISLRKEERQNRLQQILSPSPKDAGVWIYQDAWFYMGDFVKDERVKYSVNKPGNGIYLFLIDGSLQTDGITLDKRDGLGIWETNGIELAMLSDSKLLVMEVPMQ
jgi:redox-sensitive bicupin YhaK (pirin superfamily)